MKTEVRKFKRIGAWKERKSIAQKLADDPRFKSRLASALANPATEKDAATIANAIVEDKYVDEGQRAEVRNVVADFIKDNRYTIAAVAFVAYKIARPMMPSIADAMFGDNGWLGTIARAAQDAHKFCSKAQAAFETYEASRSASDDDGSMLAALANTMPDILDSVLM